MTSRPSTTVTPPSRIGRMDQIARSGSTANGFGIAIESSLPAGVIPIIGAKATTATVVTPIVNRAMDARRPFEGRRPPGKMMVRAR